MELNEDNRETHHAELSAMVTITVSDSILASNSGGTEIFSAIFIQEMTVRELRQQVLATLGLVEAKFLRCCFCMTSSVILARKRKGIFLDSVRETCLMILFNFVYYKACTGACKRVGA